MSFMLHSNNSLFVTANKRATGDGKVADHADAAICEFEKHEYALLHRFDKAAAEIRATRDLTV